jgi:hypothetical protein
MAIGGIIMAMTMMLGVAPAAADDVPPNIAIYDSSGASAVSPTGFSVDAVCELAGAVTAKGITAAVTVAGVAPGAVAVNVECVVENTGDRIGAAMPGSAATATGVVTMPFEPPRICARAEAWFVDGSRASSLPC